ncbi:mCG1048799 [Mus musculus]|nr:mCG1048799 [Mus musculus]
MSRSILPWDRGTLANMDIGSPMGQRHTGKHGHRISHGTVAHWQTWTSDLPWDSSTLANMDIGAGV